MTSVTYSDLLAADTGKAVQKVRAREARLVTCPFSPGPYETQLPPPSLADSSRNLCQVNNPEIFSSALMRVRRFCVLLNPYAKQM